MVALKSPPAWPLPPAARCEESRRPGPVPNHAWGLSIVLNGPPATELVTNTLKVVVWWSVQVQVH